MPRFDFKALLTVLAFTTGFMLLWNEGIRDEEIGFEFKETKSIVEEYNKEQYYENITIDDPSISLTYIAPSQAGNGTPGQTFKYVTQKFVDTTLELTQTFVVLNKETVQNFVVVMAASENHFEESLDGVASVQHNLPDHKLLYYDLGLVYEQIKQVKSWKNVEYRYFNPRTNPEHYFANRRMCMWKPTIIRDAMREFGGVLYMDASGRIKTDDLKIIYKRALESRGLLLFKSTQHSNYIATHPVTYDYFPTDIVRQQETLMLCAAVTLIYNTEEIFRNIFWWWILCAHEKNCMMGMDKTMCVFPKRRPKEFYAKCHKYDQSVLNVLLANFHNYNMREYYYTRYHGVIEIERWETHYHDLQFKSDDVMNNTENHRNTHH